MRLRLLWIVTLVFAIFAIAPGEGITTATAKNNGASVSADKSSSNKKRKKKKRRRSRRSVRKARGNPEVTRRVATNLIIEKLPELASLVNLDGSGSGANTTEEPASTGTTESPAAAGNDRLALNTVISTEVSGTYSDSEIDENEDLSVADEDEGDLEEMPDDINHFYKEFTAYMADLNGVETMTYNGVDKQVMMETIVDWLGTRYLFGGVTRRGIDCSAFTGMLYRTLDFKLPRTAAMQWDVGTEVERTDLQFGDLVFFHTRKAVYVSHVGIYLGNNMFAHASSRNGVTVSSLESDYYSSHYIGGRRYNLNAVVADNPAQREPM